MTRQHTHAIWGRRGTFVLAAVGSAVGLGNIWKFPYIAGENGGGAFVLMYLVCIALIGIPIMVAEVLLGRRGRANPVTAMGSACRESRVSPAWAGIGWCGVLTGFLILSYYSVIAGWTLEYVTASLRGEFVGLTGTAAGELFDDLLEDRSRLVQWQTAFIALTLAVVVFGVRRGLESAVRILMPLLFLLLLTMVGYAVYAGDFAAGAHFLFHFAPEDLSWRGALVALGHAFFTLSLAMGAIMAYGSYMPGKASIGKTVFAVAALDTLVALVAGLAIFPIVFATEGIAPGEGAGLMFISLPVAFGAMPGGLWFGTVFFALVALAAWSSTISLLEPPVAYLTERFDFHRISATLLIALAAWLLGLATVLSFNDWADRSVLLGMNPFNALDFLVTNILLPLGGLLTAIFVGWIMRPEILRRSLHHENRKLFVAWLFVLRYISPLAVWIVLVAGLYPVVSQLWVG